LLVFSVEPPRTKYDVHFAIAGIPVRVHPLFWLVSLVLGAGSFANPNPPKAVLMWVCVVFVSIVVHELGHAFAFRYFGQPARIVLYSFGGLAIPHDRNAYGGYESSYYREERGPGAKMLIALAGPLAGFTLAALVLIALIASGRAVEFRPSDSILWPLPFEFEFFESMNVNRLVVYLLEVNILWGVINLLPVFPLDGGQVARELLTKFNPHEGLRQSILLSIFAAAGVAVWALLRVDDKILAFFFGYLAYVSYQMLQQISGGYGGGRGW
jgi:Zn-dependent protease